MKINFLILLILAFILFFVLFQTKIPMCYNILRDEPPVTFVTYDAIILQQIQQDLMRDFLYTLQVNGESMVPAIKHDDYCICVPKEQYVLGDIISFYSFVGPGKVELIVHRIVSRSNNGEVFITKGDNNQVLDEPIMREQIFCSVPEKNLLTKFQFAIADERFGIFSVFNR